MMNNKELGIDGIYVVHGVRGYEAREEMLNKLLKEDHSLDFEFVTEFADETINEELIKQYFVSNVRDLMKRGAIYCTLVHILILEKVVQRNEKYTIIFENDICFLGNFREKIKPIVEEAKTLKEGFIISLENSTLEFPSWRKTKKGKYLYPAKAGRCAGAYMIDNAAAKKMLEDLKQTKCSLVIDWWHNNLIDRGIIDMYWAHPPVAEQGSFNGKVSSTISVRNNGSIRRFRWLAQKYYKMYLLRWFR